ncbi:MAG: gamma-glutamyl-gamma-aminobutyrate hydrolase family protein [Fimbriimonadales bacterium]|nr:gamma-glutamyl-gamma-aminobutyrate hydrolase family protein [Fimbriimonadales bacterium]
MSVVKPLIGITANWKPINETTGKVMMDDAYARAVARAGGVAVLIPPGADAEALADALDGLLIPGGADIDPKHYGEPLHPKANLVNARRFEQEWAMLRAFEARRKPVLGICYGCQLLNVWRGGSLYQHLPDLPTVTLAHQRKSKEEPFPRHFVEVDPASKLYQIEGQARFETVSAHHQAIREVGKGLVITAHAPDGVIEAIEDPTHPFFIGVQWHPERDPEAHATRRLFEAFVQACREI